MEIIATTKLELIPFVLPFAYTFAHKKKGDKEYWFTASGLAKIWFGGLYTKHIGKITKDEEKSLHKLMKDTKAEILFDGHNFNKFYTTCGDITELTNVSNILTNLFNEWHSRYEYEGWEPLDS